MNDPMLPLPGLSPVLGKQVVARFDGGQLSSDAGVLLLREIERRLGIAPRLASCSDDPRTQAQVAQGVLPSSPDLASHPPFRSWRIGPHNGRANT